MTIFMKTRKKNVGTILSIFVLAALFAVGGSLVAEAQGQEARTLGTRTNQPTFLDRNFTLNVCDGPNSAVLAKKFSEDPANSGKQYRPCNFNALMELAQHLINSMITLGILASLALFTYAGGLHVTGSPGNIEKAKKIYTNVLKGFIIMITAWFIVYQIVDWIKCDPAKEECTARPTSLIK